MHILIPKAPGTMQAREIASIISPRHVKFFVNVTCPLLLSAETSIIIHTHCQPVAQTNGGADLS